MTTKQKFLENLKAKIKLYQDAYAYNKDLPDDLFEALSAHNGGNFELAAVKPPPDDTAVEYGANINAIRETITREGRKGIRKKENKDLYPYEGNVKMIL